MARRVAREVLRRRPEVRVLRAMCVVIGMACGCGTASARGPDLDADVDAPPAGAARVHWQLVDRARGPCRCEDVGAGVVDVIARGPGPIYEAPFECQQLLAVTGPLAPGAYAIELRLETDDGVVLGTARGTGELRGGLVDLGTFAIEVED
jgi:hypothetical protein